jgi:3-oxoacyl-[acyl-carrier protein] reductase
MTNRLDGQVALVTGGSSGIGAAMARRFAAEGAIVGCVASSEPTKAQEVVDQIKLAGGQGFALVGDVSDWAHARRLVAEVEARAHRVDILVNSAGLFYPTPAGATDSDRAGRMIDVNLKGTLNMINAVTPGMRAREHGKVINIASICGLIGMRDYGVYCATKFGIIGLTRALAIELAPFGINVNAIAPGNTETPINHDIRTDPSLRSVYDAMKARTPSRRVYSKAEDIAGAALFLASADGVAMYGSCMVLDEGITAGL